MCLCDEPCGCEVLSEECFCPCHRGTGMVHMVACCFPCSKCGYRSKMPGACARCAGVELMEAGPLLTKMLSGENEFAVLITAVCSDGHHDLCQGRCRTNPSADWRESQYTACSCYCHKPLIGTGPIEGG